MAAGCHVLRGVAGGPATSFPHQLFPGIAEVEFPLISFSLVFNLLFLILLIVSLIDERV